MTTTNQTIIIKKKRSLIRKPTQKVKLVVVAEKSNPIPAVPADDQSTNQETERKWYVASGAIDKNFYEEYIKDGISKKHQKIFDDLYDDDEAFVDYYRVGINEPTDNSWEYSTLWFFDLNLPTGLLPLYKSGVNTSSYLALACSGLDRDEDDEYCNKTLEEILEFALNEKSAEVIKKLLLQ